MAITIHPHYSWGKYLNLWLVIVNCCGVDWYLGKTPYFQRHILWFQPPAFLHLPRAIKGRKRKHGKWSNWRLTKCWVWSNWRPSAEVIWGDLMKHGNQWEFPYISYMGGTPIARWMVEKVEDARVPPWLRKPPHGDLRPSGGFFTGMEGWTCQGLGANTLVTA